MKQTQISHFVLKGEPPIEVLLRRNARSKRFSLRVSRADGRVSLSLPPWAPERQAVSFLQEREGWIRTQLSRAPSTRFARIGEEIPVCGIPRSIVAGSGRTARFENGALHVPAGQREGAKVKALLQAMARERLTEAVQKHAASISRSFGRITLRDPRSRWGSCSSNGDLMFSFRLIMAPSAVLDYVAAHEVAHLVEMNHSDRFWALCRKMSPKTDEHRKWMKMHGAELLAWQFEDLPLQC